MKTRMYFAISLILLAVLLLTSCLSAEPPIPQAPAEEVESIPTAEPTAHSNPKETAGLADGAVGDPGEIARLFFEAYTEVAQQPQQETGSPDIPGQKYVSRSYLEQIAEIKAGFEGFGFDPVLQAQAVPPGPVEVKETMITGSQATVVLQFGRGVLQQPWERTVSLEHENGAWLIVPDRREDGALSPEETVEAFYTWYLSYIGTGEHFRNPLADRAYRAAPYLDSQFVNQVDHMGEGGGFGYDPFLCAQDVPEWIRAISSFDNAAHPVVTVESSFSGHFLTVDLIRSNFNLWTIRNITCGWTPTGTAKAFYTWLLDYTSGGEGMLSPMQNGAYKGSPYLSQMFLQQLEGIATSGEVLEIDPLLLSQDRPQAFNVEPCPGGSCALVNLQFGDATIRRLRVEMVEESGRPHIAGILHLRKVESPLPESLAGIAEWAEFRDEQYGYAIRYPAEWRPVGLKVTEMIDAAEYPVLRSISFESSMPVGSYYPFHMDVFYGTAEQMAEWYGFGEPQGLETVNGNAAAIYNTDPGSLNYVFQLPSLANTWIVLTDAVTQFPGREEAARQVEGVFDRMISTIAFDR